MTSYYVTKNSEVKYLIPFKEIRLLEYREHGKTLVVFFSNLGDADRAFIDAEDGQRLVAAYTEWLDQQACCCSSCLIKEIA